MFVYYNKTRNVRIRGIWRIRTRHHNNIITKTSAKSLRFWANTCWPRTLFLQYHLSSISPGPYLYYYYYFIYMTNILSFLFLLPFPTSAGDPFHSPTFLLPPFPDERICTHAYRYTPHFLSLNTIIIVGINRFRFVDKLVELSICIYI